MALHATHLLDAVYFDGCTSLRYGERRCQIADIYVFRNFIFIGNLTSFFVYNRLIIFHFFFGKTKRPKGICHYTLGDINGIETLLCFSDKRVIDYLFLKIISCFSSLLQFTVHLKNDFGMVIFKFHTYWKKFHVIWKSLFVPNIFLHIINMKFMFIEF